MTTYALKGGKEIAATLDALGKKIESQATRSGLTAAAAVIRDEARIRAPKRTGAMAKGIKTGSSRKNQDGNYSVSVRATGPHAFLAMFHEYGVKPHIIDAGDSELKPRKLTQKINRDGGYSDVDSGVLKIGNNYITGSVTHPGHRAQPFLRPALDAKAEEAIAAFRSKVIAVVEGKTGFNLAAGDEAA